MFSRKIKETHSVDKLLHDTLNVQGFAMHYRVISNRGSRFEVFQREGCFKAETHDATNHCYTSPRQVAATNCLV